MRKSIFLILFLLMPAMLSADYVFSTDGKDNFDKLVSGVWRNSLEKIRIRKIKDTWYMEHTLEPEQTETHKIHSLNNGVFYIVNPHHKTNIHYGYNTERGELWYIEECDEGWCLGDVPFQRYNK